MNGWQLMGSPLTGVLGAALLAFCVLLACRPGRPGRRRTRLGQWLWVLGWCGALYMALQPEREIRATPRQGRVVLVRDASGSMDTLDGDASGTSRSAVATAMLQRLRERLAPAGPVTERAFGSPAGTLGGTDIHAAVTAALSEKPTTLILVSDGDWNAGEEPRRAALSAAERGVPVFSVCVGSPEPVPDLRLAQCVVPERAAVGEAVVLTVAVENALTQAWSGALTLSGAEGSPSVSRTLTVPAHGRCWESLRWRPQASGETALTLRLPVPAGDALAANNQRTVQVQVEAKPLRVLVVDDQPRWEFRHAVTALRADRSLAVDTLLLDPLRRGGEALPPDLRGEDAAAEDSSPGRLTVFPARQELAAYAVVVLGAVRFGNGVGDTSVGAAEDLRQAVDQGGTGLILVPGAAAGPALWSHSPLAALLPVRPAEDMTDVVVRRRSAFRPQLTPAAGGSSLTALGDSPAEDAALWQRLPSLQRYVRCGREQAGAVVLATLAVDSQETLAVPLLVFRPTGLGRVLYLGTDHLWRWRAGPEVEAHARFWRGAVRALARRAEPVPGSAWRILCEGSPAVVGSAVLLHAIPMTEAVKAAPPACVLRSPQGAVVRATLKPETTGGRVLSARVALPETGVWEILLDGVTLPATTVTVLPGPAEPVTAPARPEVLEALASLSGGRRYAASDADALADAVAGQRGTAPETRRWRPWSHPAAPAAVCLLLGAGWLRRRREAHAQTVPASQ